MLCSFVCAVFFLNWTGLLEFTHLISLGCILYIRWYCAFCLSYVWLVRDAFTKVFCFPLLIEELRAWLLSCELISEKCGKALKKCICLGVKCIFFVYLAWFLRVVLSCNIFQVSQRICQWEEAVGSCSDDHFDFDAVGYSYFSKTFFQCGGFRITYVLKGRGRFRKLMSIIYWVYQKKLQYPTISMRSLC